MKKILFILLVPLFFAACNRHISSDIVTGVDVSKYKSYAWAPGEEKASKSIPGQNIMHFAEKELAERGYVYDPENPDILVKTAFSVEKKQELVQEPVRSFVPYGFGWGMWPGMLGSSFISGYTTRMVRYQEGTIVIDVFDREKNQHIWRGWSADVLNRKSLKPSKLSGEVERIFKEYPVKPVKK